MIRYRATSARRNRARRCCNERGHGKANEVTKFGESVSHAELTFDTVFVPVRIRSGRPDLLIVSVYVVLPEMVYGTTHTWYMPVGGT